MPTRSAPDAAREGIAKWGDAEWRLRCDLAALYRLADRFGMSDLIYTHISARAPGDHDRFLINPFGTLFKDITASSLVLIDGEGAIVDPHAAPGVRVNPAGFVIHSAVHLARPDIACVIHAHSDAGMAVSAQRDGLLPLTQHAMMFTGRVAYHDYRSFADRVEERAIIAGDMGDRDILILRNHGTLVAGRSIGEAFHHAWHLERACRAQIAAQSGGAALNLPNPGVPEETARRMAGIPPAHFEMFWNSCLELLDGDREYRC